MVARKALWVQGVADPLPSEHSGKRIERLRKVWVVPLNFCFLDNHILFRSAFDSIPVVVLRMSGV